MANTAPNTVEEPRPKVNIKVIVGIMLAGAFVAILNQTLLVTALPHIMRDLKIDATAAQWLTTIFMLVNGIMIPITAYLIDKFNTRALFITSIGLFALGTLIAAISPTFGVTARRSRDSSSRCRYRYAAYADRIPRYFPERKPWGSDGDDRSRYFVCTGDRADTIGLGR